MYRLPKVLLGVLAVALLLGLTMPVLAADAKGKIKSVAADKGEFVIADAQQKNWTFHLAKNAKVFINDKEAKLGDLQVDNEVTVIYEKDGDKLMASEVRCAKK